METILVVDDEPAVRDLLVRNISAAGYYVLEAASGAEALRVVRSCSEPIDLAIIDQNLDDRKGMDLATDILPIRPRIRVLLISGLLEQDALASASPTNSAVAFLQKPFTPAVLFERIRQMLVRPNTAGMECS